MSQYVGKPIPRYDGIGQVTGTTRYVDDVQLPGMLYVKVLRSPVHKGIIQNLDIGPAENTPGVAGVITAKDMGEHNLYGPAINDQPVFTPKHIRYKGERIAAVAAVDEDTAMEAIGKIKLDIEEQAPVFDPRDALKSDASLVRPEGNEWDSFNCGKTHSIRLGDVEAGFSEADEIVEGVYTNAVNDHASMEPQASVAYIDNNDRLTIQTCSQCLYFHLAILSHIFNLPMNKIHYVGGTVGGGFGGKNDIHCDHVAAAMALKLRKPVKYRLTRREETLYTTKRGYVSMEFKDGVKKNGEIVARKIQYIHDNGAYTCFGPYGVGKISLFISGPYRVPNIWIDGISVYTNKPPASSMRGFGVLNGTSACELQVNRMAEAIGMDPWEIRFINAWKNGDIGATQFKVTAAGAIEAMQKAAQLAGIELPMRLKKITS